MRFLLFASDEVGLRIAEFMKSERADVAFLVTDVSDRGGFNQQIIRALPGVEFLSSATLYDPATVQRVRAAGCDLGILAWWPSILKSPYLSMPRHGCLNFHPSLLPYNRGKHPNFWSIVEKAPFGVTIHWVEEGIDSGPIAFQQPLSVSWEDTGGTLHQRAKDAIVELFNTNFAAIQRGDIPRIPQHSANGSFHYGKELSAASEIRLDAVYRASELIDLLRARTYPPHPGAWFVDHGERYEVTINIKKVD
jgi:methionyl-tRNA formyltransferase